MRFKIEFRKEMGPKSVHYEIPPPLFPVKQLNYRKTLKIEAQALQS